MLGSGAIGYGALAAADFGASAANALNTGAHPERFLRDMESLGATHNASSDPFLQSQSKIMARQGMDRETLDAVENLPLLGHLVKLGDAALGVSRAMDDAAKATRGVTELHEYNTKRRDALETRFASLSGDEQGVLNAKHKQEAEKDANDLRFAENKLTAAMKDGDSRGIFQAAQELSRTKSTSRANREARELENQLQDESQDLRDDTSDSRVRGSRYAATAAGQRQAGNPLGAMLTQQKSARESSWQKYQDQLDRTDLDPRERTRLEAEQSAAMSALAAQQRLEYGTAATGINLGREGMRARSDELGSRLAGNPDEAARKTLKAEQDRQYEELKLRDAGMAAIYKNEVAPKEREQQEKEIATRRISEASETATRIKDIEGRAQDEILRAQGHTYEAMTNESKRQTDARVADLERQATAMDSIDKKRAGQLRDEAAAEKKAGKDRLGAIEAAASREADIGLRRADNDANVAQMEAGGHNFAAHKQAIEDRHSEEVDKIMREGGEGMMENLAAAGARRDAAMTRLNTGRAYANRDTDIATREAEAHAHGQAGVGNVLAMQAQFRDMEKDAAGDPAQLMRVHRYEQARMAATKRDMTPSTAYFGLSAFHDAVQTSIGRGSVNTEAIELMKAFRPGDGRPDRSKASGAFDSTVGDRGPGAPYPADVASAAKNMNEAANTIKNFRGVAVIGGNN